MGRRLRHGCSNYSGKMTLEYAAWSNMLSRCRNPNNPRYNRYGGRGITVCARWDTDQGGSFENFLVDMGLKPSSDLTLERLDNDKGYSPENCAWKNWRHQYLNRENLRGTIDLTGNRYDNLVVTEKMKRRRGTFYWLCQCDCGKQTWVRMQSLRGGTTKSCGCRVHIPRNLFQLGEVDLSLLNSQECMVIIERSKPRTLQSIGDELGVSRERVRQIQEQALKKIKGIEESPKPRKKRVDLPRGVRDLNYGF